MLSYSSHKISIDRRAWLNNITIGSLDRWVNFGSQGDTRSSFWRCSWMRSLHRTRMTWWASWAFLLGESFWMLAWTQNMLRDVDEVALTVFFHIGPQILGCSALGCRVLIRGVSLSWTLYMSLYDRALWWVSHRRTTMVIGCAILHCNKFGTMGDHRILGINLIRSQSIVALIAAVLQASVLCSGPHIVSLVWLTTWNCHWCLQATKRIGCIQINLVVVWRIDTKCTVLRPLRLSSLFLLKQSHGDRAWLIDSLLSSCPSILDAHLSVSSCALRSIGWNRSLEIAEATTFELLIYDPIRYVLSKLVVCHTEATTWADRLPVLSRRKHDLLLACGTLLHVAVERCFGIWVNCAILARILRSKGLIVSAWAEPLRKRSLHLLHIGRGRRRCSHTQPKIALLSAV